MPDSSRQLITGEVYSELQEYAIFLINSITYEYESLRFAIPFTRESAGNATNASPGAV